MPGKYEPQTFNDGCCAVYSVENIAEPGARPQEGLVKKLPYLRYQDRTVGVMRSYVAEQEQVKIDRVIRISRQHSISNQDICIPTDGKQYKIRRVQYKPELSPPVTDLELTRLEVEFTMKPEKGAPGG